MSRQAITFMEVKAFRRAWWKELLSKGWFRDNWNGSNKGDNKSLLGEEESRGRGHFQQSRVLHQQKMT